MYLQTMTASTPSPLTDGQIRRNKRIFWGVVGVIVGAIVFLALSDPHVLLRIVEIPVFLLILFIVGSILKSSFTTGVIVKKPRR